jgi:hypothetical protein
VLSAEWEGTEFIENAERGVLNAEWKETEFIKNAERGVLNAEWKETEFTEGLRSGQDSTFAIQHSQLSTQHSAFSISQFTDPIA